MRKISTDFEILSENIQFKDKNVVDIGCGTGESVRLMALQGGIVIGIDTAKMINKPGESGLPQNAVYLIGTGEQLPLGDCSVDVATYIASFHHIPANRMIQALKECQRVLKPEGKAVLLEPIAQKGSYYEII